MKIFSDKQNPNTWKILIAAKYNDLQIEVPEFDLGAEAKSKDFLAKSPMGKVPVLETDKGSLFESNAAARFVGKMGKAKVVPSSPFELGLVDQWIDFTASEVDLPASVWIYPILGLIPNNATATQKAKGDIRKVLDILNNHLLTRTFLVGERITLADIVVSMSLHRLYTRVIDSNFRKAFQNVNRWFLTCVNQPEFVAVIGETKLAEKMEVAPEATKEQAQPKKEAKKQPKQEAKPKKEAPEEEEAEKPKSKNPLDALPPSKFVMDEWKRTYSNEDTLTKAIPWFWENYDPEGYSIWFADYKYNDELEKTFMTCNLVGGFIQRLDPLRKHGFGSIIIFGEDPKLEIGSCWLFRGQEVPPAMSGCDDSEHYTWRKADTQDPATRKLVDAYWAWEGDFGRSAKMNQGKIFK